MNYIHFVDSLNKNHIESIKLYLKDVDFFEDEEGYYIVVSQNNEQLMMIIAQELNLKMMISYGRDRFSKLMLNYCRKQSEMVIHISKLVFKLLLANDEQVKLALKRLFSKVEQHLLHSGYSYLINDMNIIKTSKVIYVHRNTLNYRLQQFYDQTGINLQNYENGLLLYYYMNL